MTKPKINEIIILTIKRRQEDGTFREDTEQGKIVKVEDSEDKCKWKMKVKTSTGTYTTYKGKK